MFPLNNMVLDINHAPSFFFEKVHIHEQVPGQSMRLELNNLATPHEEPTVPGGERAKQVRVEVS
jgi:hypothetical protein